MIHRQNVAHIYAHIPFCARICPYCAFYKTRADPARTQEFCQALVRELEQQCATFDVRPETLFFGGGTPTALSTSQLDDVLSRFADVLDLGGVREWTVEANPGSVSRRKAELLKARGVTRISLGVQSWDDALLRLLGREHNAQQAAESYQLLRAAGFGSVSIDLMFGLPGQTLEKWCETLVQTIALEPDHISAYCLTYEEDTEFFVRHARGEFASSSDSDGEFFEAAMEMLERAGYEQYEISNYARSGHRSLHNQAYWAGADYLGIGPSAVSTIGTRRWQNIADYVAYTDRVLSGESTATNNETIDGDTRKRETAALSLRTRSGVPAEWFDRSTADEFMSLGLLQRNGNRFVLTRRGRLLADSVAEAFV